MVIGAAGGTSIVSVLIIQHWIFSNSKSEGSLSLSLVLEIKDISRTPQILGSIWFKSEITFIFYFRDIFSAWYIARNVIPIT